MKKETSLLYLLLEVYDDNFSKVEDLTLKKIDKLLKKHLLQINQNPKALDQLYDILSKHIVAITGFMDDVGKMGVNEEEDEISASEKDIENQRKFNQEFEKTANIVSKIKSNSNR